MPKCFKRTWGWVNAKKKHLSKRKIFAGCVLAGVAISTIFVAERRKTNQKINKLNAPFVSLEKQTTLLVGKFMELKENLNEQTKKFTAQELEQRNQEYQQNLSTLEQIKTEFEEEKQKIKQDAPKKTPSQTGIIDLIQQELTIIETLKTEIQQKLEEKTTDLNDSKEDSPQPNPTTAQTTLPAPETPYPHNSSDDDFNGVCVLAQQEALIARLKNLINDLQSPKEPYQLSLTPEAQAAQVQKINEESEKLFSLTEAKIASLEKVETANLPDHLSPAVFENIQKNKNLLDLALQQAEFFKEEALGRDKIKKNADLIKKLLSRKTILEEKIQSLEEKIEIIGSQQAELMKQRKRADRYSAELQRQKTLFIEEKRLYDLDLNIIKNCLKNVGVEPDKPVIRRERASSLITPSSPEKGQHSPKRSSSIQDRFSKIFSRQGNNSAL